MPQLKGAVSASRDTSIRLWRRGSPEAVQVLRGHELAVTALALNGGTGELCSGSRDSYVRLWDLGTAYRSQLPAQFQLHRSSIHVMPCQLRRTKVRALRSRERQGRQ